MANHEATAFHKPSINPLNACVLWVVLLLSPGRGQVEKLCSLRFAGILCGLEDVGIYERSIATRSRQAVPHVLITTEQCLLVSTATTRRSTWQWLKHAQTNTGDTATRSDPRQTLPTALAPQSVVSRPCRRRIPDTLRQPSSALPVPFDFSSLPCFGLRTCSLDLAVQQSMLSMF